ncbi:ARM repeat-containing protein [Moesziomyces antarcticus]|uniref:Related to translation activator GCN1 n=2 Tax=Pseudozyma antarctica TaxID=84753 RepID=A0A5C3FVY8_PSEA2|nr:ARM repeat-containing protein [Moesziomyces antarcticus]GAK66330.1 ARM repeat-containing protein [Moesziomyces antarcticus]SPO48472.1 related to translation activator GCN1 [Moesziomyces antarcticus]
MLAKKRDLKNWIQRASSEPHPEPYDSDDDLAPAKMSVSGDDTDLIDPLDDWPAFAQAAQLQLNSTSTRQRLGFLNRHALKAAELAELQPVQRAELLTIILRTYAKYIDRESRLASISVFSKIVATDEAAASPDSNGAVAKHALAWLKRESERIAKPSASGPSTTSLSTLTALHAFVCSLYATLCSTSTADNAAVVKAVSTTWEALVHVLAANYDAILAASNGRDSVRKNAVALTRRTLRNAHAYLPHVIRILCASQTPAAALRSAPLLGEAIGVSLRLRAGSEQVKGAPDGVGRGYVNAAKSDILAFYSTQILASKTVVPQAAIQAFEEFIAQYVTEHDLSSALRPQLEKMLLRSPEVALLVATSLFSAVKLDVGPHAKPLLTPVISASRSSNAATRTKAADFFSALSLRIRDDDAAKTAVVDELIAILKGGKAATPEARSSIYAMLSSVAPGEAAKSSAIVDVVVSLLAKEAQEAAMHAAVSCITTHLRWMLIHANTPPPAAVSAALVKELQNSKVPIRKAVCLAIGELFWSMDDASHATPAARAFAESLLPGFEANLKNASTNPLTAVGGPLEGYIATAVLEDRLAKFGSDKIDAVLTKNAALEGILVVDPKPSFLLAEKVFRKIASPDEEIWLSRALQAVVVRHAKALESDKAVQVHIALALIHVLFHATGTNSKRSVLELVQHLALVQPILTHDIITSGVSAFLQQPAPTGTPTASAASSKPNGAASAASTSGLAAAAAAGDVEDAKPSAETRARDLRRLLSAANTFSEELDSQLRKNALVDTLVLSHHTDLLDRGTSCFMDLTFKAKILPIDLVTSHQQDLLAAVRVALDDPAMRDAGFAAQTTLVRLAPDTIMAELASQVEADCQFDDLHALTQDELGMWRTEPGSLYIDVLSAKKEDSVDKNSKNAKMEQWEAELRADIAKKKAAQNKTLTKDQKAAVDAQAKVEAQARAKVQEIRSRYVRSLSTVSSIVGARTDEIQGYMQSLVAFVLRTFEVPQARELFEKEAKDAFWALSSCCSIRLEAYSMFVAVAILRTIDEELVQEDFRAEPINELVLRILYRLRSLSEQSPLDATTVAFIDPLIVRIVRAGGFGVDPEDTDSVLEQIQLSLDFIDFHGSACESTFYPRSSFMDSLVTIVAKHTQISKDAVSALRDIGEALRTTALPAEIQKLLSNTMVDEVYVRNGCLQAIQPLDLTDLEFPVELWLACHDEDEENARLAEKAWEENGLDVPESFADPLITLLEHKIAYVRESCARALAAATEQHPEQVSNVISKLCKLYQERNKVLAPEYDRFGMVIESTKNRQDPWQTRAAIAVALRHLAPLLQGSDVQPLFEFMIDGQALGDRSEDVRPKMLEAATAVIDLHGKEHLSKLIAMFEAFFSNSTGSNADDGITEAVVILLGREARHLDPKDPRVSKVVDRLIDALKTPSELVQSAVADCLPPLVLAISKDVPRLFQSLFRELFDGPKYAGRRGAAYGLAGLVMGRGIGSIKEFDVMDKLADAFEDAKNPTRRQGVMFAYETLTLTLKRLFEPYIIGILPHMLAGFGDVSSDVREATQDAAKAIMQTVSGHCVKIILPTLLSGLDEKQWRTKKGAIELLGAMAYCAPKQLSLSLPTVIPRLSEVLTDSHTQVRTAANKSLKQFGEVINNPEIKELVPVLLKALIDPNTKTGAALKRVLETSFVHYIDSPSLALVIPIIDRGLKERSATIQKDAARIVGNLAGLTDSKDFVPYLGKLIPMVRLVLISPVPEARAVAAKALGTLVERLGEVHFVELVPSLLGVLRSDATGVDRQGAAQGLAEVLAGLGMERMENLLPEIINSASDPKPYVREGHISLLIYLPATFGHRFAPHLGRIIPPILSGIADDAETVREASMRAGRMIIANYSSKAVDLLLPHLETGLFDEAWRIRMSSLQLTADLLFRLSGISGKNEVEDEGIDEDVEHSAANNSVQRALIEALGQERRDRILASIYIVRQDPNIPVRQAAIHTWKALVHNTPRTAREVLPTMLDILIKSLASNGDENREMAARTLGELVKKLGEKILRETIPILRMRGATSEDAKTRSGVCYAVTEVLANSTKTQLEDHEDAIIAVVRHALVDESPAVRHAAAQAFDATQTYIGPRAIDETIPTLLEALSDTSGGTSETALAALREVMRARSDVVFPVLVPTLIAQPITSFNARALAVLVRVAGSALNRRLSSMLTALSKALDTERDETVVADLNAAVEALLGSVSDVDGLHQTMLLLLGWAGSTSSPQQRVAGCNLFKVFCQVKKASVDVSDYLVDWLRKLVSLLDDPVAEVVDAAWSALDASLKTVGKDELEGLVVPLRRSLENTGAAGRELAGLCRPKGASPLVPVFLAGLMNGTPDQRQNGALGLSDIVERTSAEAIKPFVTSMIGPLIRLCGDRHPPPVKAAILTSLDTMVRRIPALVRPFYPQLQRSYQKAVSDASSATVRAKAGVALGNLMGVQTRVDPVIAELVTGARAGLGEGGAPAAAGLAGAAAGGASDPAELADSFALALAHVLANAPAKNVGAASREQVVALVDATFGAEVGIKDAFRQGVAEVVGSLVKLDAEMAAGVLQKHVVGGAAGDVALQSQIVRASLERDAAALHALGFADEIVKSVMGWISQGSAISRPAKEARELIRDSDAWRTEAKAADWI